MRLSIMRSLLMWVLFFPSSVLCETPKLVKPYRTFVTVMRYHVKQNGDVGKPISNVRVELVLPDEKKRTLPEGGQFWSIGEQQVQEINRTYEIPWSYLQNDGFKFQIQMVRKGSDMLPCNFDVAQLSEFNRSYVCHTDLGWQAIQKTPADQIDEEGIQVRVFTDLNSPKNEIPKDAIAIRDKK